LASNFGELVFLLRDLTKNSEDLATVGSYLPIVENSRYNLNIKTGWGLIKRKAHRTCTSRHLR
jgi:hypothetical protein